MESTPVSSLGVQSRGTLVCLDDLLRPTLDGSSPLRKVILGIFSDIETNLEFMLRPYCDGEGAEFDIARIRLLIDMGSDEIVDEALEELPEDIVGVDGMLEASVECLFDILPTICQLQHLKLMETAVSIDDVVDQAKIETTTSADHKSNLETIEMDEGPIKDLVEYDLEMASAIQKSLIEAEQGEINTTLATKFQDSLDQLSAWQKDVGSRIDMGLVSENEELVQSIKESFCRLAYCFRAVHSADVEKNQQKVKQKLEEIDPDLQRYTIKVPYERIDAQSALEGINACLMDLDRLHPPPELLKQPLSQSAPAGKKTKAQMVAEDRENFATSAELYGAQ